MRSLLTAKYMRSVLPAARFTLFYAASFLLFSALTVSAAMPRNPCPDRLYHVWDIRMSLLGNALHKLSIIGK